MIPPTRATRLRSWTTARSSSSPCRTRAIGTTRAMVSRVGSITMMVACVAPTAGFPMPRITGVCAIACMSLEIENFQLIWLTDRLWTGVVTFACTSYLGTASSVPARAYILMTRLTCRPAAGGKTRKNATFSGTSRNRRMLTQVRHSCHTRLPS